MDEQKVFDKFVKLSQDDETQRIMEELQRGTQTPTDTSTSTEQPKPADQKGYEAAPGTPAAPGDFGTAAENLSNVAPIPGFTEAVRGIREAMKPTPEELTTSKSGSFMEKIKALPKGIGKAIGLAGSNIIPATGGEAALMGATGKVLKGVTGGIKAAGQAFHATPGPIKVDPASVKLDIQIRSSNVSKVAPEEYGTVKQTPYVSATPEQFFKAKSGAAHQEYLTQHNVEDLTKIQTEGGELTLSADGKTGYVISPTGDLQNLFNYGEKGAESKAVENALKGGKVKSLDTFEGPVAAYYRKLGFTEVSRVPFDEKMAPPGWGQTLANKPDVVFFKAPETGGSDKEFASKILDIVNQRRKRPYNFPKGYEGELGVDPQHSLETGMAKKENVTPTFLAKRARRAGFDLENQPVMAGGSPGKPVDTGVVQEAVLKDLVEQERKTQGSRIVTPNDVSRAIGRDLLPNEDSALKAEAAKDYTSHVFGLAEQATAVKNKVMAEIANFRGGQLESEEQIKYFFDNYIEIAAKMENTLEEAGRALQAGGQADVKQITKMAEILKMQHEQLQSFKPDNPLTGTQIARMIDTLGFGRAALAARNAQRLGWDMLTSHIYFSELSNPRTWEVNFGVSAFIQPFIQAAAIAVGTRLPAKALSDSAVKAGEMVQYHPGAAEAHLVGALNGFMTAVRHVKESWNGGGIRPLMTDLTQLFLGKNELERGVSNLSKDLRNLSPLPSSFAESLPPINTGPQISAQNLNRFFANHPKLSWAQFDPEGTLKPAAWLLDAYGEGAHFTRQVMEAGDRMSYLINEHAHRASNAYSRAVEQGLTGDDLTRYWKQQVVSPTALIQKAANKGAMHDIFREKITGGMGSLVKGLGHPAFRPIATYVRTPVNIASVGLEGWPGLNRLVGSIRADYEAGGARGQLAKGRWMVGSLVTAVGASMALSDWFTGYGPLDSQARQAWLTTHEPFAIKIRDTGDKGRDWVSLKYIQPISTWMGAAADFVQMKAWEEQPEKMAEYMWAPVVAFSHAISNTVFTNDLFNFLDAVQIKPHQTGEQWARAMELYVENRAKNIASPFPSAAGKTIQSIYDPIAREVRGIGDAIKSTIPGWSSTLPKRLDYFGQEQKFGPEYTMLMTPLRGVDAKYDKVTVELAKNAPHLLTLPSIVDKTELTSKDVYNFKNIRGNEVKLFGGKKFADAMLDLVNSDKYQKMTEGPHGMKAQYLSSYVAAYTKTAIARMAKEDPRFYNLAQQFENAESLTGKPVSKPNFLKIQPQ